jgi:hypothetical protein
LDSSGKILGQLVGRVCGQLVGRFVGQFRADIGLLWTTFFHTCVDKSEAVFYNLFSHLFARSEVVVLLPLFTPVLTGVRQYSCVVLASV